MTSMGMGGLVWTMCHSSSADRKPWELCRVVAVGTIRDCRGVAISQAHLDLCAFACETGAGTEDFAMSAQIAPCDERTD